MISSSPLCSQCGAQTLRSIKKKLMVFNVPQEESPSKIVQIGRPLVEIIGTPMGMIPTPGNLMYFL